MTLDGRIATHTGSSRWITNERSRGVVHELRGRMDAIVIGRGTVIADDPLLTARPPGPRVAARVVVSASAALPADCQLLRTATHSPVMLYTSQTAVENWSAAGAEVVSLPDLTPLAVLSDLGARRFTNVLLEGGPGLLGSFFEANAIDEVHAFIAPKLVGGAAAPGPIGGHGIANITDALHLCDLRIQSLDGDFYLQAAVNSSSPPLAGGEEESSPRATLVK